MTVYNLDKGVDNDVNGQTLKNWISNNRDNIHNLTIKDKGIATIETLDHLLMMNSQLLSVDFSNFNTAKATSTNSMFVYCGSLNTISNFNTSNVTDMKSMFECCYELTTIPNFNTTKVLTTANMCQQCYNLVNVPNFNAPRVTNMSGMFYWCKNLADVPEMIVSHVSDMSGMCQQCNSLSDASIQNIINMCLNSNITNSSYMNLNTANNYSPLANTIFDSSYYQNRLTDLTNAGWTY